MSSAASDRRADAVTLGILAGGQGTRLGGIDKAWLQRDGVPQVVRIAKRLRPEVDATLVSSNGDPAAFAACGLAVVADAHADAGPLAGLQALAAACRTPWLLSVPVDVVNLNDCLLRSLRAAGRPGACVVDAEGVQPLLALWDVAVLRQAASDALADRNYAVQALHQRIGSHAVRLADVRLGNLNTPADLTLAGVVLPEAG